MISDACVEYLNDSDLPKLLSSLKYYLNDETFRDYYYGDIRIRCEWLILEYTDFNPFTNQDPTKNLVTVNDQVKIILDELDRIPKLT